MPETIKITLDPDGQSIGFSNNSMVLKLSAKANNGLAFSNGKLVATKAPDGSGGSGGTMNTPGNAIGPVDVTENTSLNTVGFNSTVSRHKKYTGTNSWLRTNDGPVMTKNSNGQMVPYGSVAHYMILLAIGG